VLGAAGACLLAAYLLMQAAFRSWRRATLAALTVPLALVGGLVVALIDGRELTLGAMTGLLAAFALATRMVLVMVDRLQSADADDQPEPREERVRTAAAERLQPVLATTVGVGLLALPFAVLGARPGLEVLQPMALVLLGSLLTTAAVTLGVVPAAHLLTSPAERRPGEEDDDLARPVDLTGQPRTGSLVAEPSP
jgi:Cu/Ag efflux pump CusA